MIRIFEWDANRKLDYYDEVNAHYLTNGLGTLLPTKCVISETLNGEYELLMEHPIDEVGKWKRIQRNRIITAPVPNAPHPIMKADATGMHKITHQFRRLTNLKGPQRLKRGPVPDSAEFSTEYKPGTEFLILAEATDAGILEYNLGSGGRLYNAEPGWVFVRPSEGDPGFIQDRYLRYSRTVLDSSYAGSDNIATDLVIPSMDDDTTRHTIKDQPFRIYKIEKLLDHIVVHARHISYDHGESFIPYIDVISGLSSAARKIGGALFLVSQEAEQATSTRWRVRTNIRDENHGRKVPDEWVYEKKNLTEVLFGSSGLIDTFGGEVARDNNDVYWFESIGRHRGVYVRSGKNLTGITFTEDWSEVVNRIMPIGKTEDGEDLFLNGKTGEIHSTSPNLYVTKASLDEVPFYRTAVLDDGDCDTVAKLKAAAEAEFAKGCDQPRITASVQFELLGDSEEYAQYHKLQGIFLGDTIYAKSNMADIDVPIKMTQYTYNCLTQKYESMTLGTPEKIDLKV